MMRGLMRVSLILLVTACSRAPAQPPATNAGCATAHPEATAACIAVLKAGGNAIDAAVAASAALAVVEPTGSGMGGGGFWLVYRVDEDRSVFVDGRETAPMGARLSHYLDNDGRPVAARSLHGALAAGIPGQAAALEHLSARYGRQSLASSLAPAVRLAADGFIVDQRLAEAFARHWARFDDGARATFAIDGRAPQAGERLLQPDLAALLAALQRDGSAAFYGGGYAQRLVDGVRAAGGHWQPGDLEAYRVVERAPVVSYFRDARITSAPPPSAGGIALAQIFGQLEALGVRLPLDIEGHHLFIEAMRRAYADRARYLGDPDAVFIPQQRLMRSSHARRQASGIDRQQATPSADLDAGRTADGGSDTTHLSVMDAEGNRVAATLTINIPFGAAMVVPGTGILLNNELDDFAMSETVSNVYGLIGSRPNLLAPGRRPLSSMTPTFVESPRGVLVIGTPGGSRIITMVALGIVEWLSGGDLDAVAARPRFHHQFLPDEVQVEPEGLSAELQDDLTRRGHALRSLERRYGNLHAVAWDAGRQRVLAASDPRGAGRAEAIVLLDSPEGVQGEAKQ